MREPYTRERAAEDIRDKSHRFVLARTDRNPSQGNFANRSGPLRTAAVFVGQFVGFMQTPRGSFPNIAGTRPVDRLVPRTRARYSRDNRRSEGSQQAGENP